MKTPRNALVAFLILVGMTHSLPANTSTSVWGYNASLYPTITANAYDSYRTADAYWEARIDFVNKTGTNPEVIWETGNADGGFSLLYLPGNVLGLYLKTNVHTNPELLIEYPLPQYIVDRAETTPVVWSVDLRGSGQAAISLWVEHEMVATATGTIITQRWSGSNANLAFGTAWGPAGGVELAYFPSATAFDDFDSFTTMDANAALRFWNGKQLVNTALVTAWGATPVSTTVTGADVPFVSLQAEGDPARLGGNAVEKGDHRDEGGATDLDATARESVGRKCVVLPDAGSSVDFVIPTVPEGKVNFITVRYSIPDDNIDSNGIPGLWREHPVTVQVKRSGSGTFEEVKVRQITRFDEMTGDTIADPTSHYKLWLNAKHMWNYWRVYGYELSTGCCRSGDQPIDDWRPDESAVNPDGCMTQTLVDRNKDSEGHWLDPFATRRLNDARMWLDTSVLTGAPAYLEPGDTVRVVLQSGDISTNPSDNNAGTYYVAVDLMDVEYVDPSASSVPTGFISITDNSLATPAVADDGNDDSSAFTEAVARVKAGTNAGVWIPAGFFRLNGSTKISLNYGETVTIRGAGMAKSVIFGLNSDFWFYATTGGVFKVSDLSFQGDGNERESGGKMFGGVLQPGTELARLHFQFTTAAVSTGTPGKDFDVLDGSGHVIAAYFTPHMRAHGVSIHDLRVRDTTAGGIIMSSGSHNILIQDCHVRGTGDDSYAAWSVYGRTDADTTRVVFDHCTAEANWRGGGFALYGGFHNRIDNVVATDTHRVGLWVAGHFNPLPFGTSEEEMTYVLNFDLQRCGRKASTVSTAIPGAETFQGALRLQSDIIRTVTYEVPATCTTPASGASTTAYHSVPVSNLLLQNGSIIDSTNDAVFFDYAPSAFTDIANNGSEPFAPWGAWENVTFRDIDINGVGSGDYGVNAGRIHDIPETGAEHRVRYPATAPFTVIEKNYLKGTVYMDNVTVTGTNVYNPPFTSPPFYLIDPNTMNPWP